jgi:hypothetical protein
MVMRPLIRRAKQENLDANQGHRLQVGGETTESSRKLSLISSVVEGMSG